MKNIKKSLAIILSVILIFAVLPFSTLTASAVTSGTTGDCTWSLDGTILTISGNGAMENFLYSTGPWGNSITEVIIENGVTNISGYAFYYCENLNSITIPNTVTEIYHYAFYCCTNLKKIFIPQSVTFINNSAFYGCRILNEIIVDSNNEFMTSKDGILFNKGMTKLLTYPAGKSETKYIIPDGVEEIDRSAFDGCCLLTNVILPNSINEIGMYAFRGCSALSEITIPNGVECLGDRVFDDCTSLVSVFIPESVSYIDDYVFGGCSALKNIYVSENNVSYCAINSVLFNNDMTNLIHYPAMKDDKEYIIPDGVIAISSYAFENSVLLTTIRIPNSVKQIGSSVFTNCSALSNVYYSGDINDWCNIDFGEFYSNPSQNISKLYLNGILLEGDVILSNNVTKIPEYAFQNQAITSITIPNSVTSIGAYAFANCSIETIDIPDSICSIGYSAFAYCTSLTSVILPNSITDLPGNLFNGCSLLTNITVPNSITNIEFQAFAGCSSLINIFIPNNVISIGIQAFMDCSSLKSITLPDSITSIGDGTFSDCYSLATVTIPKSVVSIGSNVFRHCYNLEKVYYLGDINDWCNISIGDMNPQYGSYSNPVHYADELYLNGKLLEGDVTLSIEVSKIPDCAFQNQKITSITIPNSVTSIGAEAFYNCDSLQSVSMPNSITEIGERVFAYCDVLKKIELPENISAIKSSTFSNSGLKVIYIPAGVTTIDTEAFYNTGIKYVFYGGDEEDRKNINILSGNDSLENAIWLYNQIGLPEHEYDNDCDNLCNICEMIRVAPNHIDSYICDKSDCNYTRIVTKEDLQNIIDAIPDTLHLDILEKDYENSQDSINEQITNILQGLGFRCKCREEYIFINAITKEGYDIRINAIAPSRYSSTPIFESSLWINSINDAVDYYNDEYRSYKRIYYIYTDTDTKTLNYIRNLQLVSPTFYAIDIDKMIKGYDLYNAAYDNYTRQINDDSLKIIIDSFAGGGIVNDYTHGGLYVYIYKNDIYYDYKGVGEEYTVPIITIPYELPNDKAYDYVVEKITELYKPFGENITSIEKSETIYDKPVNDGYIIYSNCQYDDEAYVIIRKSTQCTNCTYDDIWDGCCNVCETMRSGWFYDSNNWYFYQNGNMLKNAWQSDSVGWVYLGSNGAMVKNTWVYYSGKWYFVDSNGYQISNKWIEDSVGWLYLGSNGAALTNEWLCYAGKWYHFDSKGYMETEKWVKDSIGWVYLGSSGAMLTNSWCTDSQGWCYVGTDGYAVTNCWKKDSIGWIYLNSNGSMTKNKWIIDGGKWYYLDANGYMASNKWMKDSVGWVYLGSSGAMLTNAWCTDSSGWCYVGADGYAVTNCWKQDSYGWIYLNKNGSMTKSNWVQYQGKWYYLNSNGYMVYNTTLTIGGVKYKFDINGVWIG